MSDNFQGTILPNATGGLDNVSNINKANNKKQIWEDVLGLTKTVATSIQTVADDITNDNIAVAKNKARAKAAQDKINEKIAKNKADEDKLEALMNNQALNIKVGNMDDRAAFAEHQKTRSEVLNGNYSNEYKQAFLKQSNEKFTSYGIKNDKAVRDNLISTKSDLLMVDIINGDISSEQGINNLSTELNGEDKSKLANQLVGSFYAATKNDISMIKTQDDLITFKNKMKEDMSKLNSNYLLNSKSSKAKAYNTTEKKKLDNMLVAKENEIADISTNKLNEMTLGDITKKYSITYDDTMEDDIKASCKNNAKCMNSKRKEIKDGNEKHILVNAFVGRNSDYTTSVSATDERIMKDNSDIKKYYDKKVSDSLDNSYKKEDINTFVKTALSQKESDMFGKNILNSLSNLEGEKFLLEVNKLENFAEGHKDGERAIKKLLGDKEYFNLVLLKDLVATNGGNMDSARNTISNATGSSTTMPSDISDALKSKMKDLGTDYDNAYNVLDTMSKANPRTALRKYKDVISSFIDNAEEQDIGEFENIKVYKDVQEQITSQILGNGIDVDANDKVLENSVKNYMEKFNQPAGNINLSSDKNNIIIFDTMNSNPMVVNIVKEAKKAQNELLKIAAIEKKSYLSKTLKELSITGEAANNVLKDWLEGETVYKMINAVDKNQELQKGFVAGIDRTADAFVSAKDWAKEGITDMYNYIANTTGGQIAGTITDRLKDVTVKGATDLLDSIGATYKGLSESNSLYDTMDKITDIVITTRIIKDAPALVKEAYYNLTKAEEKLIPMDTELSDNATTLQKTQFKQQKLADNSKRIKLNAMKSRIEKENK